MKVTIINSPLFKDRNELYDEDSLPPIGLGLIATNLQNHGIDVELIDAVHERIPLNELIEKLNTAKPEFIASNIFTTNYNLVKELFESVNYNAHFIIGGLSTKQLYEDIVEWKTENHIDIVAGDGELITLDIINKDLKENPFFETESRRYFLVDGKSKYWINDISNVPLNRDFFLNEPVIHPLGFLEANIVTSRGCIYNCAFCAAARSLNKTSPIRERSEESLIKELKDIKENYPLVNSIRVLDDLFLKHSKTVEAAISVFSKFDFQWRSMAHVMTFKDVDATTLKSLKESGCHELFIGIESGSPKILKSINKTYDIGVIEKNLTKVFEASINIKGYFIYGFPDENEDDMKMTFELAEKLKIISQKNKVNFRTSVFQYRPYHGTEIYHNLEKRGFNLNVIPIEPNKELCDLIGRQQFNFHSGNYSEIEVGLVHRYICRTIDLNDGKIFAGLEQKNTSA